MEHLEQGPGPACGTESGTSPHQNSTLDISMYIDFLVSVVLFWELHVNDHE